MELTWPKAEMSKVTALAALSLNTLSASIDAVTPNPFPKPKRLRRLRSTMVVDGNQLKVFAWYDNEWGYSCRTADLVAKLGAM